MFHHPDQEEGEKIFPWEISGLRKYCGVCHVFIERRSEWVIGQRGWDWSYIEIGLKFPLKLECPEQL